MARFDIYQAKDMPGYLLDCQANVLDDLSTRIAVPLLPPDYGPPVVRRLNPTFAVEGEAMVMFTQYLSSIEARELGRPVGSLADQHDAIMDALDMLLTGY